ncbi:unnamed protein product [Effrenium voratum]|nr:unnamed protein product [Effrenium voratum]
MTQVISRCWQRRLARPLLLALAVALGNSFAAPMSSGSGLKVDSDSWLARGRLGPMASEPAVPARISKLDSLGFKKQQLHDAARNIAFIAGIAATIVGSQVFTGKWWKVPLGLALPSMIYRLLTTKGNTEKLAQVSASVDSKYIASTEEAQKELHMFMCSGCGYTLFPARGREGAFFNDKFKCPMCGASKDEFVDMNDEDDDGSQAEAAAAARKG